MFFNRKGINQKNWRMIKKGKHFLFGCTLFLATGAVMIQNTNLIHADEKVVSMSDSTKVKEEELNSKKSLNDVENDSQVENHVKESDKISENVKEDKSDEKAVENTVKTVDKTALNELIEKIKNTNLQTKTVKSVENLNLSLSRAQAILDKETASQTEIDKEVRILSDSFAQLEEKSNEIAKKEEQTGKSKDSDEKKNILTEKIDKVQALVSEINQLAGEISYEFSESESKSLQAFGDLSEEKSTDSEVTVALNEAKSLRNKLANRVTRAHSGKRDPRNGQVIENSGESTFRGIRFTPLENVQNGKVVSNANTNLTYFNSDSFWIKTQVTGEKFRHDRVNTYYLVKKVTLSGKPFKDLSIIVSSGSGDRRAPTMIDNINNPNVQAGILGTIGSNGIITPGNYQVVLTVNDTVSPANNYNIIYNVTIKPQSERNTVRDLTPTYVDDVRHLTEAERTALLEKFKTEHPDVVNRAQHIDFERAEVSADGATMTIYFKDGFNPKTIQSNATNDVEAKHSSLTTLIGDPHEFYKNPRNLVKSKTNHEVPQTARVTWKTPFDFSQPGTKNAVVTVSYDNGVTKDVTTPYTVLDFIGKQDKRIYQNQSGELGDARSYITLSNGTAPATDLTIRWKGGSSVDTSAQGTQRKEIEILRGNTVMKTVTIPVAIVDNINPTITAPDSVMLTRAEGLPSNISIDAQDNARGIGLKDANPIVVENLANPLRYNPSTKRIELSGVIPNNFQRTQATIKAIDKNGNTATKTITFNVQAQTDKYTAVANPQKQTVSYLATPSAEASVSTAGLPTGTRYTWKTIPNTSSPGDKTGVVEVTYPDTSKDTVNVTIAVRKLSDEHEPTGTKITRNQNVPVTNNDLKAAVTISNNGNSKVKSVIPVSSISTVNAGMQTIRATVTYLDNTTDPVEIPLEVKDVTAPTIQTPNDRQNWDLIALDRTLPSITVTSVDNNGGTGIKSTTVTGLPDFLVYDNATKTIKFKNGVQEVTKLPAGQDSKTYNATIQVTDNSNNPSQRQVTITVKSMTTKYDAVPNSEKQTVSYGATPDAGTSVDKTNLPEGTSYAWKTTPVTTTPGEKDGVVEVTYKDGSKDTVNVKVTVKELSSEYDVTGSLIEVNQNTPVTNDDLKAKVTATSKAGNASGTDKISTVVPKSPISTVNYGDQNISAVVTFKDGTTKDVTIPLKVKDVTDPTIQKPAENTNWEITALDRVLPNMKVEAVDNANGSGIETIEVSNIPEYLTFDSATKTIVFKDGIVEVPKFNDDRIMYGVTIVARDKAGNSTSILVNITVWSMKGKYNPQAIPQTVDNGHVPNAEESVNKTGLPEGVTVTWKTTPEVTTPGSHPGVALVHYPDGTEDEVEVPVTVREQKETFNPTAKEPNQTVRHNEVPDPAKSINTNGLPEGTTYTWSEQPNTSTPGSKPGKVLITYPDHSTEEVPVTVEVTPQKDEYTPTGIPQTVDNGHVPNAEESVNKTGLPEGVTVTWKTTPEVTTPGSHPGVALVHYPDGTEDEVEVPVTVNESEEKGIPETQPGTPDFTGGVNPPDAPANEVPAYTDPIGSTGVDEDGNLIEPPVVEAPGYSGGVNGELPDPTQLPKVKLIITKWVDEKGNELKPADAKAPKVLGESNEAFEHGEIEGYVFVRTETKGDVVTHVFRKVSPARATGDGQQRPATPSYDTNPRQDIATPAEVPATQPAGQQPSQTVEVPAQLQNEVSETNPSVSQPKAILPNTGTQEDRATGALGVLSLLGAFGLLFAKKKKDDEEKV